MEWQLRMAYSTGFHVTWLVISHREPPPKWLLDINPHLNDVHNNSPIKICCHIPLLCPGCPSMSSVPLNIGGHLFRCLAESRPSGRNGRERERERYRKGLPGCDRQVFCTRLCFVWQVSFSGTLMFGRLRPRHVGIHHCLSDYIVPSVLQPSRCVRRC